MGYDRKIVLQIAKITEIILILAINAAPKSRFKAQRSGFESKGEEQGNEAKLSGLPGSGAEWTLRRTGQAVKGARGMPWHWEPMKDVTSCDKLWGAANGH